MPLPHISLIAAFVAYFSKVRMSHIFPHKSAFSTAIFISLTFLLPISIRFRYLDHLVANRMAPAVPASGPMWKGMGVVWLVSSSFVPYFRRTFGVYAVPIFFLMPHKTDIRC